LPVGAWRLREGALEATAEHGGRGEARLLGDLLYLQVGGLQQAPGDLVSLSAVLRAKGCPFASRIRPQRSNLVDFALLE
tara:strand:+ start:9174 stop:9410 length:237 start_codon:yes stop_codon:yes gene_type:complete